MRKLDIRPAFERDVRRLKKARIAIDWETLRFVFSEVIQGNDIEAALKPHPLKREWAGWHDFHLDDDLLVVYRLTGSWATFHRIGTHTDLFRRWRPRR